MRNVTSRAYKFSLYSLICLFAGLTGTPSSFGEEQKCNYEGARLEGYKVFHLEFKRPLRNWLLEEIAQRTTDCDDFVYLARKAFVDIKKEILSNRVRSCHTAALEMCEPGGRLFDRDQYFKPRSSFEGDCIMTFREIAANYLLAMKTEVPTHINDDRDACKLKLECRESTLKELTRLSKVKPKTLDQEAELARKIKYYTEINEVLDWLK